VKLIRVGDAIDDEKFKVSLAPVTSPAKWSVLQNVKIVDDITCLTSRNFGISQGTTIQYGDCQETCCLWWKRILRIKDMQIRRCARLGCHINQVRSQLFWDFHCLQLRARISLIILTMKPLWSTNVVISNLLAYPSPVGSQSNLGTCRHPQTSNLLPPPQKRRLRRPQHGYPAGSRL
jgi:hypothetical protein